MPLYQVDVDGQTVEFDSPVDLTPEQLEAEVSGFRSQIAPPAAPEEAPGYISQLGTSLYQGGRQALGGARTAFNALTGDTADMAAGLQQQAEAQRALQEAQTPEDVAFLEDLNKQAEELKQARGFLPTLSEAIDLPMAALRQPGAAIKTAVQSLPNALISTPITLGAGVLGTAAGGLVGLPTTGPGAVATGIAGGIAAGTAANTALEAGSEIYQRFVERIGDPAGMTREQIAAALDQNPDIASEGLTTGLTRGAVIGTIETLGLKGAGALLAAPERAAIQATRQVLTRSGVDLADDAAVRAAMATPEMAKATKAAADAARAGFNVPARAVGAGAVEIGASGVGEALAQQAVGQETDYADVFLEMLGEGVAAAPSVLAARGVELAGTGIQAVRERVSEQVADNAKADARLDIDDLINNAGENAATQINQAVDDAAKVVPAPAPAPALVSEPTPITPVEPLPAVEAEAPAAVETQTQPEPQPQPRDEIQIAEAGGLPPVESQPLVQTPADEAPEGVALGGREGQEGQVIPEPVQPVEAAPETGAATEDWLSAIFVEPAPQAQTAQTPEPAPVALADQLDAFAAQMEASAQELASRQYKRGRGQVELRGDGPSRKGSMSFTEINESRRARGLAQFAEQSRRAQELSRAIRNGEIASDQLRRVAEEARRLASEEMALRARNIGPQTDQPSQRSLEEGFVSRLLLGDTRRTTGPLPGLILDTFPPTGGVPTESLPAGQPTSGDVGTALRAVATNTATPEQVQMLKELRSEVFNSPLPKEDPGRAAQDQLLRELNAAVTQVRRAASANVKAGDRLKSKTGKVVEVAEVDPESGLVRIQGAIIGRVDLSDGDLVPTQDPLTVRKAAVPVSQKPATDLTADEVRSLLYSDKTTADRLVVGDSVWSVSKGVGQVTKKLKTRVDVRYSNGETERVAEAYRLPDNAAQWLQNRQDLSAVATNTATPEQVASLEAQGLARTVQGQPVITDAGLTQMPKSSRPRLTEAERVAEIASPPAWMSPEAVQEAVATIVLQKPLALPRGAYMDIPQGITEYERNNYAREIEGWALRTQDLLRGVRLAEGGTLSSGELPVGQMGGARAATVSERTARPAGRDARVEFKNVDGVPAFKRFEVLFGTSIQNVVGVGLLTEEKSFASKRPGAPLKTTGYSLRDGREFRSAVEAMKAFLQNGPDLSARQIDRSGMTLPEGYVREGDLYVFRPEGGGASSTNTPPANIQPSIRPLQGDQQRNETSARRRRGKAQVPASLRDRDGPPLPNIKVNANDGARAREIEDKQVPGAKDTWIGTAAEYLAEFPDQTAVNDRRVEAFYDAATDRAVILIDRVVARDGDAIRAARNGTSAAVEAVRRLIRHESFVHRGWRALPQNLKTEFLGIAESLVPEEEIEAIVAKGYSRYAGWRTDPAVRALVVEEWLAQRLETLEKLPATDGGPLSRLIDWAKRVWQWLNGNDAVEPTRAELVDVMRQMIRALEIGEKSREVAEPIRPSFIGEKAQMSQFMRDSLETARSMAAAGKSSEEIRAVTGWFPGLYDGKMRWELPDNEVTFTAEADSISPYLTIGQAIDNPALFEAYPDARNIYFKRTELGPKEGGYFDPISNRIVVNSNKSEDEQLSSALHEIQHWIQGREKFAEGSSPDVFYWDSSFKPSPEAQAKLDDINAERVALRQEEVQLEEFFANLTNDQKGFGKNVAESRRLEAISSRRRELSEEERKITKPERNRFALSKYRATAGEIEARDVQARRTMTPEQRRATAPYSSENIAPEDAVVIFDGREQGVMASLTDIDAAYMGAVYRKIMAKYDGWKSTDVLAPQPGQVNPRPYSPIVKDLLIRKDSGEDIPESVIARAIDEHFQSKKVDPNNLNLPSQEKVLETIDSRQRADHEKTIQMGTPEPGTPITARQDVPSHKKGVGVTTTQIFKNGKQVGTLYFPSVRYTDPVFSTTSGSEKLARRIAKQENQKTPAIKIDGKWSGDQSIPADLENWTQVGFNPDRHSYYYEKGTNKQVFSGDEAFQVGNTVFVKNPNFEAPADFQPSEFRFSLTDPTASNIIQDANQTTNEQQPTRSRPLSPETAPGRATEVLPTGEEIVERTQIDKTSMPRLEALAIKFVDSLGPVDTWPNKILNTAWWRANGGNMRDDFGQMVMAEALYRTGIGALQGNPTLVEVNDLISREYQTGATEAAKALASRSYVTTSERYGPMFAVQGMIDQRRRQQETVIDANVDVAAGVDAVNNADAQAQSDASAELDEELRLKDAIYELGLAARTPEIQTRIRRINDNVFRLGVLAQIREQLLSRVQASFVGLSRAAVEQQYASLSVEQIDAEIARLEREVADDVAAVESERQRVRAAPKPKGAAADPITQARTIIARLEADPKTKKTPKANPVRDLYREHLKNPMAEDEFMTRMAGIGVPAAEAQKLYDLAAVKIAATEAVKAQREAESKEDSPAVAFAKRTIDDVASRLADPALPQEERQRKVLAIRELYKEHVRDGLPFDVFISRAEAAGVEGAMASTLHGVGMMEREARETTRGYNEAQAGQRFAEKTINDAATLYADPALPQPVRNKRRVAAQELYNKHVKKAMAQAEFLEAARKAGVNEATAMVLFNVGNMTREAREAQAYGRRLIERRERLLDAEGSALENLINKLRGKITGDLSWREMFDRPLETQRQWRRDLFAALRNDPALAGLTPQEIGDLVVEIDKVWEAKRKKNFEAQLKRMNLPGAKGSSKDKIAKSAPKLLRYINAGFFNDAAFRNAISEEFGIPALNEETVKQVVDLMQRAQADGITEVERKGLMLEAIRLMQRDLKAELGDILSNYWVTSVLSGFATQFDMAFSALNGMRVMAQSMADLAIRKREFKLAGRAGMAYLRALGNVILEAARYFYTGDPKLLDNYQYTLNTYLTEGSAAANPFDYFERIIKDPNRPSWAKIMPYFYAGMQRAMTAFDHINSTATTQGMLEMAMFYNRELYEGARMPSKEDVAAARAKAVEMAGGDKTWGQKREVSSYTRQILNELLNKKYPGLLDEARDIGKVVSYTNDPTGIGGIVYHTLLGVTNKYINEAGKYRDEVRAQQEAASRTKRFMANLNYIAAANARNLTGLRFVRFVGNRLNEILSFTPGFGLFRLQEKGMTPTMRAMIIQNQTLGFSLSVLAGVTILRALTDEEDDEKRGFRISGSWSSLPPDKKNQLRASDRTPYSIEMWDGKKWISFNYNAWPIASIIATVGNLNDQRLFNPEKWEEKDFEDKLLSAAWAGAFSFKDLSALSGFMDMIGKSAYSTDPVEGATQWLAKFSTNYIGGFVPRMLKDIDLIMDPETRKARDFGASFAKELPFFRRTEAAGEKLYNIFGEPVKLNRMPWRRAVTATREEPEYETLAELNRRGIFLGAANPSNRTVGSGATRRELTDAEAEKYMVETGKLYRDFIKQQGQSLLQLDRAQAEEVISKTTERLRAAALRMSIGATK